MDFLKNQMNKTSGEGQHNSTTNTNATTGSTQQESGGFMSKINGALGGGQQGEKKEDMLDKGVDFIQEKFFGHGKQDNESAVEQAKDEQISDAIRRGYKSTTGKDFFIPDKS